MLIIEILVGVAAGLFCLIPGWNTATSAFVALAVSQNAAIFAVAVGLITSSYMESLDGISTGNFYINSLDAELDIKPSILINKLVNWKCVYWGIGLGIGIVLPPVFGGSLLLSCIAVVTLAMNISKKDWYKSLIWLLMIQLFMLILNLNSIAYPIGIIGASCFIIPNAGQSKPKVYTTNSDYFLNPDNIGLVIGGLIALCTPGVSAQAVTTTGNRTSLVTKYMTTAVVESLIEAIALAMLAKDSFLGKTIIGSYGEVVSPIEIVICLVLVLMTKVLLLKFTRNIDHKKDNRKAFRFIACFVASVSVLLNAGLFGIICIGIGICIAKISERMNIPSEAKGLTFITNLV